MIYVYLFDCIYTFVGFDLISKCLSSPVRKQMNFRLLKVHLIWQRVL